MPLFCLLGTRWHCPSNVQNCDRAWSPRVLHQQTTRRTRVLYAFTVHCRQSRGTFLKISLWHGLNPSGFCSCVGPVVQNSLTVVNPLLFLLATKNDLLLDLIYPVLRFYFFFIAVSIDCASVSKRGFVRNVPHENEPLTRAP